MTKVYFRTVRQLGNAKVEFLKVYLVVKMAKEPVSFFIFEEKNINLSNKFDIKLSTVLTFQ